MCQDPGPDQRLVQSFKQYMGGAARQFKMGCVVIRKQSCNMLHVVLGRSQLTRTFLPVLAGTSCL
jgi:hypothetical protein